MRKAAPGKVASSLGCFEWPKKLGEECTTLISWQTALARTAVPEGQHCYKDKRDPTSSLYMSGPRPPRETSWPKNQWKKKTLLFNQNGKQTNQKWGRTLLFWGTDVEGSIHERSLPALQQNSIGPGSHTANLDKSLLSRSRAKGRETWGRGLLSTD